MSRNLPPLCSATGLLAAIGLILPALAWLWPPAGWLWAADPPLGSGSTVPIALVASFGRGQRDNGLAWLEQGIFAASNHERQQAGRPLLWDNAVLADIAASHSLDMVRRNFFSHNTPEGIGSGERAAQHVRSLFGLVSENLAMMTERPNLAAAFVQNWLTSPGHKANLLHPDSTDLGVGCAQTVGAGGLREFFCTQLFMNVYASLAQPFPVTAYAGQSVDVALTPRQQPMPTRLLQVDAHGWEMASVVLHVYNGMAQGSLTLQGPPGQYRMQLEVPDRHDAQRLWIIPGPYVQVR